MLTNDVVSFKNKLALTSSNVLIRDNLCVWKIYVIINILQVPRHESVDGYAGCNTVEHFR